MVICIWAAAVIRKPAQASLKLRVNDEENLLSIPAYLGNSQIIVAKFIILTFLT